MNKPASELIALADRINGHLGPFNFITRAERELVVQVLRTAANQSGSERAGVDALEIARAVRQRAANLASGYPKNDPEHLRWLHHSYGADEVAYKIDEALATPPAQPAPANESHAAASLDLSGGHNTVDAGGFDLSAPLSNVTIAIRPSESPSTHGKPADDVETCIACNTAFVEGDLIYPDQSGGCIHVSCCGPEMESYVNADGEPLKEGDPLPTPQRWTSAAAETSPGDVLAMKEALARAFCVAKGVNPDCLHQNYDDEPVDLTDAHGRTFHFGWRNQLHLVDAAMPFIDRLDVKAEAKSQEPEAVAIKPLEWVDNDSERVGSRAQTILGEYVTWISEDECCYLQLASQFKGHPHGASIDAAKAAAQSDYERRILSALITGGQNDLR